MQSFTTKFTLSRDYLAECFDQSLPHGKNPKPNYLFPTVLCAVGVGLLFFTEQPMVVGSVFIALAVVELFHIRYKRAWWLAQQMWAKSANSEITLTLDDEGVKTQSPYTQTALLWTDIERVIETELGLILVAKSGGQQYLSKSLLAAELIRQVVDEASRERQIFP